MEKRSNTRSRIDGHYGGRKDEVSSASRRGAVWNRDILKGSAEKQSSQKGGWAKQSLANLLSVEETPPTLNATINIILPLLITELKEEVSDVLRIGLAYKVVDESLM